MEPIQILQNLFFDAAIDSQRSVALNSLSYCKTADNGIFALNAKENISNHRRKIVSLLKCQVV